MVRFFVNNMLSEKDLVFLGAILLYSQDETLSYEGAINKAQIIFDKIFEKESE